MSINSNQKRDRRKAKAKRPEPLLPHALHQLDTLRKQYIKTWRVNSNGHLAQGHYSWMAAKLDGYPRTLEIGCGIGHSTLALLKQGHSVVCVEENPHCISATQALIAEEGYSVAVITRGTAKSVDENAYRLIYSDIGTPPKVDCLLIEGDALKDPKLEAWLMTQPKFDSIACWLIGTHDSRGHNIAVDAGLIPGPREHRIFVQNSVYELADHVLRSGGILNVIDRAQPPSNDFLANALLDSHREQASVTSLQVQTLDHIPHKEADDVGALRMQITAPKETLDQLPSEGAPEISLCSITSVKP